MNAFVFNVLLTSTLWWGVVWAIYRFQLKGVGIPSHLRKYLIGSLAVGLILPFVPKPAPTEFPGVIVLPVLEFMPGGSAKDVPTPSTFPLVSLLAGFYLTGVVWLVVRQFLGWCQLRRLRKEAQLLVINGVQVFRVEGLPTPFQFGRDVYMPADIDQGSTAFAMILQHEMAHQRLNHGSDILLSLILRDLFWFHPLVHLLVKELRLVHEFEADQEVIRQYDRDKYVRLIGQFRILPELALPVSSIIQGPIKQRIMNIYAPPRRWGRIQWMQLALFGFLAFGFSLLVQAKMVDPSALVAGISGSADTLPQPPAPPPPPLPSAPTAPALPQPSLSGELPPSPAPKVPPAPSAPSAPGEDVRKGQPDEMPRFPGCEHLSSLSEKEACSTQGLMKYVYSRLKYPEQARANGVEGTVIVSFTVTKEGHIGAMSALKDIGYDCAAQVMGVLKSMNDEQIIWRPGFKEGHPVNVELQIPVKFKLSSDDSSPSKEKK